MAGLSSPEDPDRPVPESRPPEEFVRLSLWDETASPPIHYATSQIFLESFLDDLEKLVQTWDLSTQRFCLRDPAEGWSSWEIRERMERRVMNTTLTRLFL